MEIQTKPRYWKRCSQIHLNQRKPLYSRASKSLLKKCLAKYFRQHIEKTNMTQNLWIILIRLLRATVITNLRRNQEENALITRNLRRDQEENALITRNQFFFFCVHTTELRLDDSFFLLCDNVHFIHFSVALIKFLCFYLLKYTISCSKIPYISSKITTISMFLCNVHCTFFFIQTCLLELLSSNRISSGINVFCLFYTPKKDHCKG